MLAPLFDEVEERFSVYVFELRQILKLHNLPVEGEGAVAAIAGSLSRSANLRLSMGRMMRAMIRRELEQISSVELLAVLMRAAGHEPAEAADGPEEAAIEELLGFILEVRYPEGPGSQRVVEESRGVMEAIGPQRGVEESRGVEAVGGAGPHPGAREVGRPVGAVAAALASEAARVAVPEPVRPAVAEPVREMPVARREVPVAWQEGPFAGREGALFEESGDGEDGSRRRLVLIAACAALIGFGIPLAVHQRAASSKPAVAAVAEGAGGGGSAEKARPGMVAAARPGRRAVWGGTAAVRDRGVEAREAAGSPGVAREDAGSPVEARGAAGVVSGRAGEGPERGVSAPGTVAAGGTRPVVVPVSLGSPVAGSVGSSVGSTVGSSVGSGFRGVGGRGFVRSASAGIMAGNVISSPSPAYPVAAAQAGVQGEVTVRAVVGRDGNVSEARVVSGPPLLRAAAVEAVEQWQYRPYVVDGKPAAMGTTAIVEFRLGRD